MPSVTLSWLTALSLSMGLADFAQGGSSPRLAGTWAGSAKKTVCGQGAGSVDVSLDVWDEPYRPATIGSKERSPLGSVWGKLYVGGNYEGVFVGDFDRKTSALTTSLSLPRALATLSKDNRELDFVPHFIKLTAADPYLRVGYYQKLTGTMSKMNPQCSDQGGMGEVLTVDLQKKVDEPASGDLRGRIRDRRRSVGVGG